MSRKFKVSSNYDGPSWYDSKSGTWFHTNKVVDISEDANYENIRKYIIRNYIYEIQPETKEVEKPFVVTKTMNNLLVEDRIASGEIPRPVVVKKDIVVLIEDDIKQEEPKKVLPDLDNMTKAELLSYADQNGIKVDKNAKKAIIIEAIKS